MDINEPSSQESVEAPRVDNATTDDTTSHKRRSSNAQSSPSKRAREEDAPVHLLKGRGDDTFDTLSVCRPATVEELRRKVISFQNKGMGIPSLSIVHGMPADYVWVIKTAFHIDRAFIEAHAERKAFRSVFKEWDADWAHWEYPEFVVEDADKMRSETTQIRSSTDCLDVLSRPRMMGVGRDGTRAVFCRASLWYSTDVVLFLDKQFWKDIDSPWAKARRTAPVKKLLELFPDERDGDFFLEGRLKGSDKIPSFEDELLAILESQGAMEEGIRNVIPKLAYHRWIDFFEMLPLPEIPPTNSSKMCALVGEMIHALEKNVDMMRWASRATDVDFHIRLEDWETLVVRARSRMHTIVNTHSPVTGICPRPAPESTSIPLRKIVPSGGNPGRNNNAYNHSTTRDSEREEINKRSLDRVTYLGGLLLPITVVSSILAIEGSYGPEGDAFWVFWVASVVSSAICVFIIYLDQLRGLDFWVEISASDAVEAMMRRQPTKTFSPEETDVGGGMGGPGSPAGEYTDEDGDVLRVGVGDRVPGTPVIWLQRSHDGLRDRAWRRDRLGWGGACKKALGYYYFKGGKVRFDRPDREGSGRY